MELVAGTAGVSHAVSDVGLSWYEAWEVENGLQYDLTDLDNLTRLFRDLRALVFWFIHIGPP